MSVLSSWGSVEAGKAVDGADGAMDTGIQAYRYRLSVEHLVGEAMRSSGTPNWKSRAVSWLGAEVGEEVGEAKAAITRLLVVGLAQTKMGLPVGRPST